MSPALCATSVKLNTQTFILNCSTAEGHHYSPNKKAQNSLAVQHTSGSYLSPVERESVVLIPVEIQQNQLKVRMYFQPGPVFSFSIF